MGGYLVLRIGYLVLRIWRKKRVLEEKGRGSELLKLTGGQSENAKIKGRNAKLWNPDGVGMGVLIVVLVGIIRGQIMVYVGSCRETGQSEKIKRIRTNLLDGFDRLSGSKLRTGLRVFSTGLLARALQRQPKNVPDTFNYPRTPLIIPGHL
jgi:hypothetical protein